MTVKIKTHKRLLFSKLLLNASALIPIIYICLYTLLKSKNFDFNLNFELENWKTDIIDSLSLNSQQCSQSSLSGWEYQWPGSKDSCDCRFSDEYTLSQYKLKRVIYWQQCSADMTICSCKNSVAQKEVGVSAFDYGKFLCVARRIGVNFRSSVKFFDVAKGDCKEG